VPYVAFTSLATVLLVTVDHGDGRRTTPVAAHPPAARPIQCCEFYLAASRKLRTVTCRIELPANHLLASGNSRGVAMAPARHRCRAPDGKTQASQNAD
jgi:hypothetical protein